MELGRESLSTDWASNRTNLHMHRSYMPFDETTARLESTNTLMPVLPPHTHRFVRRTGLLDVRIDVWGIVGVGYRDRR
jgi:hypothetical protein